MRTGYSILDILDEDNGVVVTNNGCVSLAFRMDSPECYSLDKSDLEKRNTILYQAFKHLPDGSWVHKQDVFLLRKYQSKGNSGNFLQQSVKKHFSGREYLDHECVMIFTLSSLSSLSPAYNKNPYAFKENLHKADAEKYQDFIEGINSTVDVINSMKATHLHRMNATELHTYIERYINFFPESRCDRDLNFEGDITIGEDKAKIFTICDEAYLPDSTLSTDIPDTTLPISNSCMYMSELEGLGIHLHCNHVVNQLLYFEGSSTLYEQLSRRVSVYRTNMGWDRALKIQSEDLEKLQGEIQVEKQILCRANVSVMIWDKDIQRIEWAEKKIRENLSVLDFKFYIPSYGNLANLFLSSVPGQENGMSRDFMFLSTLSIALCLFINYTNFKNDEEGIYFNDRIFQIPLKKDIWDARKKRIPARNGMVIASTGGGKSVTTLNILQQLHDQGYTSVVVEYGNSFEQLCKLYPEKSLHVNYDGKSPLGLNPFDLDGKPLDDNKLEVLSGIVQRFWSHMFTSDEGEKEVALTKFIMDYYEHCPTGHSFPSFYQYVLDNYDEIRERQNIIKDYFDLNSFRTVCSQFMPGGRYENVCRQDGQYDFGHKDLIVFELTQVKNNVFLSSLVMTLIFDVIHTKILSDRKKRGMIIFDEYGEICQMKDKNSNISIHSTVAFFYQKIRKENGAVMTIVQTPDQLPDDEYTKSMIANTQLLYVLPTTDVVYQAVQDKFKMSNSAQINMMRSIQNGFAARRPYSECFLRFQEQYAIVVRIELSPEKFLAFQTEGEIWSKLSEMNRTMPMQRAIEEYIQEQKK